LAEALGPAHDVVVAPSAAEGFKRLRENADFDVVFCNLTLPQTSGKDFDEILQRELPNILERLVFLSDQTGTSLPLELPDRVPNQKLAGPLNLAEISSLIAQSIDSADS